MSSPCRSAYIIALLFIELAAFRGCHLQKAQQASGAEHRARQHASTPRHGVDIEHTYQDYELTTSTLP
jgi:hypothetical protein